MLDLRVRTAGSAAAVLALFAFAATVAAGQRAPGAPITIAWDPNPDPIVVGYFVYVGTEPGVYSETHDVGNATAFAYTGAVEGQHYYFSVASYTEGGLAGARSEEVTSVAVPTPQSATSATSVATLVATRGAWALRANQLDEIVSLATLSDGRVLVVQPHSIRISVGNGSAGEALTLDRPDVRLTQAAPGASFHNTHVVFVGRLEPRVDGAREFSIVRYREVQNLLGEGAVVISGLTVRGAVAPSFTLDHEGRIYIAMPGDPSDRTDPYAGRILRFNADGTVPADNASRSPVLVEGYRVPAGLKWDGRELWAGGRGASSRPSLATLAADAFESRAWQQLGTAGTVDLDALANGITAFDVARDATDESVLLAFIDSARRLHRVRIRGRAAADLVTNAFEEGATPVAVSIGPQHDVSIAVRTNDGFDVLHEPARPARPR
jgi:hypothetical protein